VVLAAQTEAPWTGAADFQRPYETTPGYTSQRIGGWGGDRKDHTPRRNGIAIDYVIVLVHGNSCTADYWASYRAFFQDRGFNDSALWALSWCGEEHDKKYDILSGNNGTDLEVFLEAVTHYTGVNKVRLVTHSQGTSVAKDMLYEHVPTGLEVTHMTTIAGGHGDKTSAVDGGVAGCLFATYRNVPLCSQEFGDSQQAVTWRDDRVITDPRVRRVQVIYSGTTSDARFYETNIFGDVADVRYSARDNIAGPGWPGRIEYSQHGNQSHAELKDSNISEVFDFIAGLPPDCGDGSCAGSAQGEDCVTCSYDCGACGPAQELFSDDFSSGLGGWTVTGNWTTASIHSMEIYRPTAAAHRCSRHPTTRVPVMPSPVHTTCPE
jgi:pimeloyl-ACP methyl ester carboxylesterase